MWFSCSRRAYSLAEVLLTSFLVLLVLGAVATLVRGYRQVSVHERAREASLRSASALSMVKGEVWQAVAFITPLPPSGTNAELNFSRLDPNVVDRLEGAYGPGTPLRSGPGRRPGDPVPEPSLSLWDPFDPAYLADVRYVVENGELVRWVTPAGGTAARHVVAENVVGFSATWTSPTALALSLRCREERKEALYQLLAVVRP